MPAGRCRAGRSTTSPLADRERHQWQTEAEAGASLPRASNLRHASLYVRRVFSRRGTGGAPPLGVVDLHLAMQDAQTEAVGWQWAPAPRRTVGRRRVAPPHSLPSVPINADGGTQPQARGLLFRRYKRNITEP